MVRMPALQLVDMSLALYQRRVLPKTLKTAGYCIYSFSVRRSAKRDGVKKKPADWFMVFLG